MITSLLAIIPLPLSGAMQSSQAYALFGNEAVFFVLGAFILAAGVMLTRFLARGAAVRLPALSGCEVRVMEED